MLDRFRSWLTPPPEAKAATGIGVSFVINDPPLSTLMGNDHNAKAKKAQQIGTSHRWIRAAERVISTSLGSVDWHLETEDDEAVTDESPEPLVRIRDVLEKPYRPLPGEPMRAFPRTKSGLWGITSRHTGLCGYAFWFIDSPDQFLIPANLLYVNPARMTAAGEKGELVGWILDADGRGGGTPLPAEQVLMFSLEEADEGWYPAGLVETAMSLATLTAQADRHAASTLRSGGRVPGVFAPSAAVGVMPPDVFTQLEKELRSAHEDPDARRRDMVLKGPIEFTTTAATNEQLDLVSLLNLSRDDTLALWGVPPSQLGVSAPAGLNSGSTKSYDEAALWQKAIHPRLERMRETIQFQLLDPIGALIGQAVELELDEPTFDDDAPKYELAVQALSQPLRNVERRAILGMDPIGDDVLDNAIWMPMNIVETAAAPPIEAGKAKIDTLIPRLAKDLTAFLARQQKEVAAQVRAHAEHVARKPGDTGIWWNAEKWDAELRKLLRPYMATAADLAAVSTEAKLGTAKAGEAQELLGSRVLARMLLQAGKRITGINDTTRQHVLGAIIAGIDAGDSPGAIGDRIEDLPEGIFGEYRGELIARTETGTVYNQANTASYAEFGVSEVTVIDGDEDAECAAADGSVWSIEEAESNPLEHPNCTRDFVPIVGKAMALQPQPVLSPPSGSATLAAEMAELKAMLTQALTTRAMTLPAITLEMPDTPAPVVYVQAAPEQPAPIVNVTTPEVLVSVPQQAAPIVNVAPAEVTVNMPESEGKASAVQDVRVVEMPTRTVTAKKKVKRNNLNLITELTEESVETDA